MLAVVIVLLARGALAGFDFHVFYLAGERLLRGEFIYQAADGWMPFKYHPVWAVVFVPIAFVPERLANVIFNSAEIACWLYSVRIWADGSDTSRDGPRCWACPSSH